MLPRTALSLRAGKERHAKQHSIIYTAKMYYDSVSSYIYIYSILLRVRGEQRISALSAC